MSYWEKFEKQEGIINLKIEILLCYPNPKNFYIKNVKDALKGLYAKINDAFCIKSYQKNWTKKLKKYIPVK